MLESALLFWQCFAQMVQRAGGTEKTQGLCSRERMPCGIHQVPSLLERAHVLVETRPKGKTCPQEVPEYSHDPVGWTQQMCNEPAERLA